jgi:hypothetical protein
MNLLGTALAAGTIELSPEGTQFAPLGSITITGLISAAIVLILVIAALVFFFMLIYGGIRYITSGGDKAQTEAARGTITAALIGLVIVFAAWAIITLINAFFGINILSLELPTAGGG